MTAQPATADLAAAARRGVSWSTASVIVSALCGMLQLAIAARFLSRDDFGLMALILVVTGFHQNFADLGTANAVLYRQRAPRAELDSLFWLNVAVGAALCAFVAASGPLFARLWDEPALAHWLPLAAVVFLFAGVLQVPTALLRRELRFRALACIEIAGATAGLASVAGFAAAGFGVASLLAGLIAASVARLPVTWLACRRLFRPRLHFASADVAPYLGFGAWQLAERMVYFGARNLDKLVIGTWLGTEALGAYSLAYQLMIRPFRFFAGVSQNVTRSVLSRMQGDPERLIAGYLETVRLTALIAFPVYVGAFAIADPLVELVYGPGWGDVATLFVILCPIGALYAIGNPIGGLIVATGKPRVGFLWNAFSLGVHLAALPMGVRFGATGVSVALLAVTAGVLFPGGFYLRWLLVRLRPRRFLACLVRPLGYALLMGSAVHALGAVLTTLPALARLTAAVTCGATIYALLLWSRERTLLVALRGSGA